MKKKVLHGTVNANHRYVGLPKNEVRGVLRNSGEIYAKCGEVQKKPGDPYFLFLQSIEEKILHRSTFGIFLNEGFLTKFRSSEVRARTAFFRFC